MYPEPEEVDDGGHDDETDDASCKVLGNVILWCSKVLASVTQRCER